MNNNKEVQLPLPQEVFDMSMRSQIYEWDGARGTAVAAGNAGRRISIFIGGLGNNITKPAETTATQFIVIEDVAVTPSALSSSLDTAAYRGLSTANGISGPRAYVQVRINTTDYFLDPDNVGNDGIPGTASPYPRSLNFQPSFSLYPDVYVLPGQVFDVLTTFYNSTIFATLQAFVKYTLYDGPDALIANKLLEMGISINPGNVDWYKRTLIQSQSAMTV